MAGVELMTDRFTRPHSPRSETASRGGEQKQWSRPVSRVLCALRRDSHSSRPGVTAWLKQPTRERRGPRHRSPIWSCSGWGLPCRSVARLAVGSYPTVSPLPAFRLRRSALCCTFRRLAPPRRYLAPCPTEPGLSSAFANERRDCPADSTCKYSRSLLRSELKGEVVRCCATNCEE